MTSIGHTYELLVVEMTAEGALIDAGDLGTVLLPRRHCPDEVAAGDHLAVFLYSDARGTTLATTQQPMAEVGQFAYLEVVANSEFGAFLDWGLDKDLLVPFREQHRPMEVGRSCLVHITLNENDGRISASSKIEKFLDDERPHAFRVGQPVDLIIANSTDLGFRAIVDHRHWGVLYKNEVQERLSFGQSKQGFVKYVRPDGRIDLTLTGGRATSDKNAETILQYLRDHDGFAAVHDKSDAESVRAIFDMSKKAFKKAVGALYKRRLITLEDHGIRLAEDCSD